jgi:GDP-4-dehydro-6-deoxy-D-mannose reductase
MRALVTGASGFVGRWLTAALQQDGVAVTGLGFGDEPHEPHHALAHHALAQHALSVADTAVNAGPPVVWKSGDLRDDRFVAEAVSEAAPDMVVHLAAISHVPTAAADPALAWDINVTATARLLHHVQQHRTHSGNDPVVLIVGSAEQYGRQETDTPIDEATPLAPRTVYAATKAAQELLALQQWRATGLKVVLARSFNHSGFGQDPRFLLPALTRRAVALRSAPASTPLIVGNTSPIRDFLHVSDVVAAYISLLRHGVPGEAYNVASGTGRSVQQIVQRVLERAAVSAPLEVDPALVRPVDVPALVGNPRKLQTATGWRATRTFDDILDELIHAATH